jgi:hypothetical protein
MAGRKRGYVWVRQPQKPKFDTIVKTKMLKRTQDFIDNNDKLRDKVSRIHIRGNYIYLYELVEQFNPEGADYIKPLIDGKYIEFPYARITLHDVETTKCSADWQRHNEQWISLFEGSLDECLSFIGQEGNWFQ